MYLFVVVVVYIVECEISLISTSTIFTGCLVGAESEISCVEIFVNSLIKETKQPERSPDFPGNINKDHTK